MVVYLTTYFMLFDWRICCWCLLSLCSTAHVKAMHAYVENKKKTTTPKCFSFDWIIRFLRGKTVNITNIPFHLGIRLGKVCVWNLNSFDFQVADFVISMGFYINEIQYQWDSIRPNNCAKPFKNNAKIVWMHSNERVNEPRDFDCKFIYVKIWFTIFR